MPPFKAFSKIEDLSAVFNILTGYTEDLDPSLAKTNPTEYKLLEKPPVGIFAVHRAAHELERSVQSELYGKHKKGEDYSPRAIVRRLTGL